MSTVTIPAWNALGLLPPADTDSPVSFHRSPYAVSLKDVVMRFATSAERRAVLRGFLGYRQALHGLGLQSGFQWLDGSFMEDVETLEKRPPRDMDVVTFLHTPKFEVSDADLAALDHGQVKERYKVDSYLIELEEISLDNLVNLSAYWYSLWSHRRNQAWKGFLQIDLDPAEDNEALTWLGQYDITGAQP